MTRNNGCIIYTAPIVALLCSAGHKYAGVSARVTVQFCAPICIRIRINCRALFNMVDAISLVSAVQATTQLVEQAFRILKRLRTAHERQKDIIKVLERHENELSGVKTIISLIKNEEGLQTPDIVTELGRLQAVQTKLAKLLNELDPEGKGKVAQYTHQLIHGSADERKLGAIMDDLARVKSTLILCIQTAKVANLREMGSRFQANAEAIQRIDQFLREHIGNHEGLETARLLKGRHPSSDRYMSLTQAEPRTLRNQGSNSECSEDETLVDESEVRLPSGSHKTERIVRNNRARQQSVQINGPVEIDFWKDFHRLDIRDNVSEEQSLQVNYATTDKVFMSLLNRQDQMIRKTLV